MNLCLTSILGTKHADELEKLLFFHPQQGRIRRNISESVEKYGSPRIIEKNSGLRIELPLLEDVQTLYALVRNRGRQELVGALVYTRTEARTLEILHIVVKDEYTLSGKHADQELTFLFIEELCRIGRMIQGIHFVRLAYDRGRVFVKKLDVER
jgi:hypothetical protein